MPLLKPFCAWRPRSGLEHRVAAPPYDVLNSEEARLLAKDLPESFLHVSKAEIGLSPEISPYDEQVYATAKDRFQFMRDAEIMLCDPTPRYYIYRLRMNGRDQIGVAALASVDAYLQERIKKHEFTRPDKENDRTRLASTLNAHSGPVFLIHRHHPTIEALTTQIISTTEPTYDFVADDGIRHTLWVVEDTQTIQEFSDTFNQMPTLYIADGHHRAAAAARICQKRRETSPKDDSPQEPFARFLAVVFPDTQVRIFDYNRVVRDLNGLTPDLFLQQVSAFFTLVPAKTPVRPTTRHEFGMYLSGQWYSLKATLE
ncbi:MAG: DUF1015 domain-containing protein, partial [Magnetococcales bacterium]|nr:DUF1015 domain-containing protein [Magnetococcales bacterium]